MNSEKQIRGMTLVEIMVAMALGALLVGGILQIFTSINSTSRLSGSMSDMQASARIALNLISDEARMAGYKGCVDSTIIDNVEIVASPQPFTTDDFAASGISVFEVDSSTGWSDDNLPSLEGSGAQKPRIGSDVITLKRGSTAQEPLIEEIGSGEDFKISSSNTLHFEENMLALVTNCIDTTIYSVSGVTSGTSEKTISRATTHNTRNDTIHQEGDFLMTMVETTFFVGDTGRDTERGDDIYALYRRDSSGTNEVVEGIENMQIQLGQALDDSRFRFVDSDSVTDAKNVTSIKISLLAASHQRVLEADDDFEYVMNGVKATRDGHTSEGSVIFANDRRLRQTFSSTVKLRNKEFISPE